MKFYDILRERRRKRMKNEKKDGGCRYPIGDPQSSNFKFCCDPIEHPRFVYCDTHARLCYLNFEDIKDKPRINISTARRK